MAKTSSLPCYNLLITAQEGAWDKPHYEYDLTRYLEYTEDDLRKHFLTLDDKIRKEITKLPTLFAYEGMVGSPARVCWIAEIRRQYKTIRVSCRFDGDIPLIPPERIEELIWELQISSWEMNRTHWAIKEVDLLKVLSGTAKTFTEETIPPYKKVKKGNSALKTFTQLTGSENSLDNLEHAVREFIEKNDFVGGLDRLHTFTVRFVRSLCTKRGITIESGKPLHSLFGEYVKKLRDAGLIESDMADRILKSHILIMEAFNNVRNEQSLAHDNTLLSHNEACFCYLSIY